MHLKVTGDTFKNTDVGHSPGTYQNGAPQDEEQQFAFSGTFSVTLTAGLVAP